VARAELVRCAARVASLVLEPCSGFEALRDGAGREELAYADYLEGRVPRPSANEPFARLVAYAVQFRTGSIDPQGIATAVDIASSQAWRRPLLAWLGVQLKRAEQAGDSETAARLKRRIDSSPARISLPQGGWMAKKAPRPQPKQIRPDDIDPHHRWDRPLQAPGRTQVDFEERVNFRRLHDYRLARVRAALAHSGWVRCSHSISTTSATPRAP